MSMDLVDLSGLTLTPWVTLLALGALHGLNPAMGWLFAVGRGLQEGSGKAVRRALGPLALGHLLAIGLAVAAAAVAGMIVPPRTLRWVVAGLLLSTGVLQLKRHRHPRYGGMQMRRSELVIWSFLMASAHGAGLMALPFVFGVTGGGAAKWSSHSMHGGAESHAEHMGEVVHAGFASAEVAGLAATAVHTAGYLFVTCLVAVVVYEKLGLRLLRSAWINLDLFWACALIGIALVTPFI